MRLIWDIFAFLGKRLLLAGLVFLCVVAALFIYAHLRPAITSQLQQFDQVTAHMETKARELAIIQANRLSLDRQILALEASQPPWYRFEARAQWELSHRALLEARAAQQALFDSTLSAYRNLSSQSKLLSQGLAARSRNALTTYWKAGLVAVAIFFLGPIAWKLLWYYGFGSLLPLIRPVRLLSPATPGQLHSVGRPEKAVRIELLDGELLAARMEWIHEYPSDARKRTRFLWRHNAPLVSYIAGLSELTEISLSPHSTQRTIVISSGEDADRYIAQIDLQDHPGFVFRPQNIVAIVERPNQLQIQTRWRLFNMHALLTWQFRYILLSGTGRVYLAGLGGIESRESSADGTCVDQRLTAGFDARLAYGVRRTETFWPYLRGRASLLDDMFIGQGLYFRSLVFGGRMSESSPETWAGRVLNVLGKFLGF